MTEIEFKIIQKQEVVRMTKKITTIMGEYFTKADSHKISFPNKATQEEKILLIVDGLLIDYQNFERDDIPGKNIKKEGL